MLNRIRGQMRFREHDMSYLAPYLHGCEGGGEGEYMQSSTA